MPTLFGNSQSENAPHTKFVCGLGPVSANAAMMEKLIKAGANVFRNNFAHAKYDEYRERMEILRHLNKKLGTDVKMQADLQGTNIRVGDILPDGEVKLEAGQEVEFVTNGEKPMGDQIHIDDDYLHVDVKKGQLISFGDGELQGTIRKVSGHHIWVTMLNRGILKKRKHVNVPMTDLSCPAVTDKDQRDLEFLLKEGVDIVALSFICSKHEVEIARKQIGKKPVCLVGKIERKKAVENLFEIIQSCDGIMVARGDLGIELPMEEIPIIQKQIISLCHQQKKPVITATQMLLSMVNSIRPTRAEVSDVANAVFDRSDALMLSDETMVGVHPDLALSTMVKIARRMEEYLYGQPNYFNQFGL
jgi:pyruvate kinase